MKKVLFVALVAFVLAIGVVSDGFSQQYGGTLRIIAPNGPQVLSYVPMMGPGDHSAIFPAGERLLDTTRERQTGSGVEPVLAEKVDEDAKNLKITWHIRKGVKFHDGADLDAEAVRWNFQQILDAKALPYAKYFKDMKVTDNDTIKQAVRTNGAVTISFLWDGFYYNSTNSAFYCTASNPSVNHEVAIVGWDDNYPSVNFNTPPLGNGAFIVKNSWGTGWGKNGYFYLSYYDTSLRPGAQYYNAEETTNYARIYQYDPLGWVSSFSYTSAQSEPYTGWFSNIFMASRNASKIAAIGLYAAMPASTYTIFVYSNVTPGKPISGTKRVTKKGTIARSGYNTIVLTAPVVVMANKPFSVVVKLTTPGYNWPIAFEAYFPPGSTGGATAGAGQSFASPEGTFWTDITAFTGPAGNPDLWHRSNVCLKAFAVQ